MIAAAAIALGYLGIIQAFGWAGVAASAAHIAVMALATWRRRPDPVAEVDAEVMRKSADADMR